METKNLPASKQTAFSAAAELLHIGYVLRLLMLLLVTLPAVAQAQDFAYETIDDTITVTGYTGPGGAVSIPATINDLPVTSIGDGAFIGRTSLTSITIPSSVTYVGDQAFFLCGNLTSVTVGSGVISIGNQAFDDCTSLATIAIPNSVTSIGNYAFSGCTSLTSVTIGSGLASIGQGAFNGCISLEAFTVDAENSTYGSVDGVLFDMSQTALIRCPQRKTGNYTIPINVTYIGYLAFSGCISLTGVTIPSSVTIVGQGAFAGCTSLASVTIPNGVIGIGSGAFDGCTSLTSVTIPDSVTYIRNEAFYNCTGLNSVYFQGNAPSVGLLAFESNNTLTVYYLPGTTGWESTFGGRPTALWVLPNPLILNNGPSFGVQNKQFGFVISWATNASVVVEACTDLAQPLWTPVGTNTLTEGSSYFSDPQWTNHAARFYRLRSP